MTKTAAVEVMTDDIDPATLSDARIMLGNVELGRFEGRSSVRFEVPPGRHVLIIRDGFGMSAAMRFKVYRGQVARLRLAQHEPETWGLVFGGFHALQRAGTERLDENAE